MSFAPSRQRSTARSAPRSTVWACGRRVFVHVADLRRPGVVLTDESGKVALVSLADGTEVEVLAWRPRGTLGPRYRVRACGGVEEGWLEASELRATRERPPQPQPEAGEAIATRGVAVDPPGRRFGER